MYTDSPSFMILFCQDTAKGLQDLLEYDGDVEDDFGLTFEVAQPEFGKMKATPLKAGGENINVTAENREGI